MVIRKITSILICLIFIVSCAPVQLKPTPLPKIEFKKTEPYKIDLSTIVKPKKPIKIWMNDKFKQVPMSEAKYLVLAKPEYAKFIAQLRIKKTYEEIIGQQEILINQYIDIGNNLKEYLELERAKAEEYRQLWADSENAYRYEKYLHDITRTTNKAMFMTISIGSLIAAILIVL